MDMGNFWIYEDQTIRSFDQDPDVIIGDISAIFKKNVPVCAAIKIIPDVSSLFQRVTNLELILQ